MKWRSPAQQAVCKSNLDPKRRHLLRTCLDYATPDGQRMFVSVSTLALDTGESVQIVKRLRRGLFRLGVLKRTGAWVTDQGTTVQTYGLDYAALAKVPRDTSRQKRVDAARAREHRPDVERRRLEQGAKLREQAQQRRGIQLFDFVATEGTVVPSQGGTTVPSAGVQLCPPPGYNRAVRGGTVVPPLILSGSKELIQERSCAADAAPPPHRTHRVVTKILRLQHKAKTPQRGIRHA